MTHMADRDPLRVRAMFGRIVPRYDLINRLMSFGMDRRWRRLAAERAVSPGALALDVGTGTGDLAVELRHAGAARVLGADFSPGMLVAAARRHGASSVEWLQADVLRLPLPDGMFDCVTNAFVLRNLADLRAGLAEMARVLKPGGRLVCLDLTQPPTGGIGRAYRLYLERVVPALAGLISRDREAYRYLPASLEGFPDAGALSGLLGETGLSDVYVKKLGAGAVALHVAVKAPR